MPFEQSPVWSWHSEHALPASSALREVPVLSELSFEAFALVRAGRVGLRPSSKDRARVSAALRGRLHGGAPARGPDLEAGVSDAALVAPRARPVAVAKAKQR